MTSFSSDRIVCIGDSRLSFGGDSSLCNALGATQFAKNGAKVADLPDQISKASRSIDARTRVIVSIGANDILDGELSYGTIAEFEQHMSTIADLGPKSVTLLVGAAPAKLSKNASVIRSLITVLSTSRKYQILNLDPVASQLRYLEDGLHFDGSSNRLLANFIRLRLAEAEQSKCTPQQNTALWAVLGTVVVGASSALIYLAARTAALERVT